MQTILILLVSVMMMEITVFSILHIYLKYKSFTEDIKLKKEMFNFSLPINDEENLNILDKLISDEINVYTIYHFPYSNELYISEKDQNKMIQTVLKEVLKKMSPIYMSKLEYIYNKDVIEDIIYGKIRDGVLRYTIEINGTFRE